jgi:acetate kinase
MKILVINSGSSSLKFQLIETSPEQIASNTDRLLAKGEVERIGSLEALVSYHAWGAADVPSNRRQRPRSSPKPVLDHAQAIQAALDCLTGPESAVRSLSEIEGVGHRVVHGGEHFSSSVMIDEKVLRQIESCIDLAPLHNPNNLKGYYATRRALPNAAQVAVFDTAFHHALPPRAFHYGIPYVHYSRDRVRRYGFHGTSHRYLSYRFAQLHGHERRDYKLITCHLGNGSSVCAIAHGRSIDTSMGFTPLEGLLMGTRAGDVDPGVLTYLLGREGLTLHELETLLNRQSGLYGISGVSGDMRDLLRESENGNQRAALAIDIFCYRVKKYLGAYLAALNGADAIIFGGGIGENAPSVRAVISESLDGLGVSLDAARNAEAVGIEKPISAPGSALEVWVIPTNEELLIARDTLRCIKGIPHPV